MLLLTVSPDVATNFKATCAARNVSMSAVISEFMTDYTGKPLKDKSDAVYDTRKKRRRTVELIIFQMEQLLSAEETYRDNIPDNLQGGKWYDAAEQSISALQGVIDNLNEIY